MGSNTGVTLLPQPSRAGLLTRKHAEAATQGPGGRARSPTPRVGSGTEVGAGGRAGGARWRRPWPGRQPGSIAQPFTAGKAVLHVSTWEKADMF